MHSNSSTLLTAKIQQPALLLLSALPHRATKILYKMLMGEIFFEILVGGTKRGDSIFCGSSMGGTCQGWSIFP